MVDNHPSVPEQIGRGSAVRTTVLLLSLLLLAVACALLYSVWSVSSQQQVSAPAAPRPIIARGDLAADEQATIHLFETLSPSVVHITSVRLRRDRLSMDVSKIPQGVGTGFIWDEHGHIVTNFHVIQGGQGADVTLSDGTVWKASLVGTAPDNDLAVLRIKAPKNSVRPIPVGRSEDLQVGQKVFAIGNPFGLDQTLTTGVISGLGREIQAVTGRPIQGVIQTDAAINQGNSGGPLLDSAGRLIGVNTAFSSPSGSFSGVGFAVPVDTVNRTVPQLIEHGKVVRPGLGINIGTDQLALRHKITGVIVLEAAATSAAGQAGVEGLARTEQGSWRIRDVIIGLGDRTITSANDLYRALDQRSVGDTVTLTIQRDGKTRKVQIELQVLP